MIRYRGRKLLKPGFIGVVLALLIILVGLAPERLVTLATAVQYHAVFGDGGGLAVGDNVMVSGTKVGSVSGISLHKGTAVVDFTVKGTTRLGSDTTAHIKTGSLLGRRIVALDPAGTTPLRPGDTIPLTRTSAPYSLTDAVSDLTTNVAATDTNQLNQSLETMSATLDQIAPKLGPTFDALTRLSQSVNARNESLRDLLANAAHVTDILAQRSQQVNRLILNANTLLAVLVERRDAIVQLLANISVVAKEVSGLVADNEAELAPTLDRLNSIAAMLENNRDSISKALPALAKQVQTQGEAVSNGSYYNAYLSNLGSGPILQPFLDWAFGIQPRSLLPLPNCGDDGNCYNREEGPTPQLPVAPR